MKTESKKAFSMDQFLAGRPFMLRNSFNHATLKYFPYRADKMQAFKGCIQMVISEPVYMCSVKRIYPHAFTYCTYFMNKWITGMVKFVDCKPMESRIAVKATLGKLNDERMKQL